MAGHELDRILVVEGDQLVGIISEADIGKLERRDSRSPYPRPLALSLSW
jgi:CBS domain-containing protein